MGFQSSSRRPWYIDSTVLGNCWGWCPSRSAAGIRLVDESEVRAEAFSRLVNNGRGDRIYLVDRELPRRAVDSVLGRGGVYRRRLGA